MPNGKRQSPTDILKEHGTPEEKAAFAAAIVGDDLVATSDILAGIRKRLRALKPKVARAVSPKRMEAAVDKIITKYGKAQVELSVARWVAPEDRPTVSAGDTAQAG